MNGRNLDDGELNPVSPRGLAQAIRHAVKAEVTEGLATLEARLCRPRTWCPGCGAYKDLEGFVGRTCYECREVEEETLHGLHTLHLGELEPSTSPEGWPTTSGSPCANLEPLEGNGGPSTVRFSSRLRDGFGEVGEVE